MKQRQTRSPKADGWTFGIEIECLIPHAQVRSLGIRIGSYHHGVQLPAPFPAGWTAEHDSSVRGSQSGYTGLEIVSPILQGMAGIDQVKRVADILNDISARVNRQCGFHVHVGAEIAAGGQAWVAEWVAKLLYQMAMHEKAVYASTGTRRRENGGYSSSIKAQQEDADRIRKASSPARKDDALCQAAQGDRHHSLNLNSLFTRKATVEFRAFAGTTEWPKMLGHIQMCLALCERARETARMDWHAMASRRTYHGKGEGQRALQRFFYLTGWTMGRRQVQQPEVGMAGWIADLGDLDTVKHELMRLAKKYDAAGGF